MKKIFLLLSLPVLFSFTFTPMTQTINVSKGQKSVRFMVENKGEKTIPVTFKVMTREQTLEGPEKNEKTKEVRIFPPQLMIAAGEKKSVRVDYKGEKSFDTEKSFRVIAREVPVNLEGSDKNTGIKMLLKYQNALYVRTKDMKSDLIVQKFESTDKELKVYLENKGNLHQYLHNIQLSFEKKNGERSAIGISIPPTELSSLEGQNILAGATRVFTFKPRAEITEDFKATLKFDHD